MANSWQPPRDSWGAYSEPTFAAVYGDSDAGKSTTMLGCFCCGIMIAAKGGTKPSVSALGFSPRDRTFVVDNLEDALASIYTIPGILASRPDLAYVDSVYLDDVTVLAKNSMKRLREKYPNPKQFGKLWGTIFDLTQEIGMAARNIGLHAGMSFHLRYPEVKYEKGIGDVSYKGGPELPSRKLTKTIPHLADVVARCEVEPGRVPWPGIFAIEGPDDPDWETKDRHDVLGPVNPRGPMNMRELLNAGGYSMRRLPGLEWQEEVAEWSAARREEGMTRHEAFNATRDKLARSGLNPLHVRWAITDGLDRFEYRRIRTESVLNCFDITSARKPAVEDSLAGPPGLG